METSPVGGKIAVIVPTVPIRERQPVGTIDINLFLGMDQSARVIHRGAANIVSGKYRVMDEVCMIIILHHEVVEGVLGKMSDVGCYVFFI